jgi:ATP-dependent helicase YprA (DUF1998 family)
VVHRETTLHSESQYSALISKSSKGSLPCAACLKGPSSTLSSAPQAKALSAFRQGSTNVLFSTAVAEEGLDVQHCSLVICYDVPVRPISIIQTMGRARAKKAIVRFMQGCDPETGLQGKVCVLCSWLLQGEEWERGKYAGSFTTCTV